jgi:CheY-like chemotaxis protein
MNITPLHSPNQNLVEEQGVASIPRQRILVVDDVPANLLAMRVLLKKIDKDVQIDEASSGNDALSLVLGHHYSLVLLDVQMPEMDGYEVAQALNNYQDTALIPIIFVTAIFRDEQHRLEGYNSGAEE